ncbi:DNA-methyltransferase [Terrisporobacter sp.]|uniref:DNA-methyltransferase n=1 Tax=Terrisporobacter sp. TaxID=1965305 RepID=UPI00262E9C18|nr:site-specific DNA-methyltransferase [Terrisporobacter sp.]
MFTNCIYCGDCIDLCKLLDDKSVDLIIADPPYYKIKGDFDYKWDTVDEYIEWSKLWIKEFKRILKPSGSFYLWGAIGYNKGFALPKIADWIESENMFTIKNWITQRNTRGYGNCNTYMKSREELLFMVHDSNSTFYTWNTPYLNEKSSRKDLGANNKPRKNSNKRCSDVWFDITEASQYSNQRFKISDNKNFPTVKALNLCDRIIKSSSNKNDLVFIPFAGSGSEIVSCINNKRKFIASEIEQSYIKEIILNKRIDPLKIPYTYVQDNIIKIHI